ncbi:MAG: hypothetical protein R6V06_04950 [Kiritimatiellia bacterium]
MSRQLKMRIVPLLFSLFFSLASVCAAVDRSFSLFRYATPLEIPPVESPQLADLRLTEEMYGVLRDDFADLRIIMDSDRGAVPVKIIPEGDMQGRDRFLIRRGFTPEDSVPEDILSRYTDSSFLCFKTESVPLNAVKISFSGVLTDCGFIFIGEETGCNAEAEWKLLIRGVLKAATEHEGAGRITVRFPESRYGRFVFVLDDAGAAEKFAIKDVYGPDYHVYFRILPGENYTLLCGYPEAPPLSVFNTSAIDRLLAEKDKRVDVRVSALKDNQFREGTSLKDFAFQRSFLIPLVVVAVLIVLFFMFVIVYSIVNRRRSVKSRPLPRFFK